MSFTADNPPFYIRPLLDEYTSLAVDSCGYTKGAWVTIEDETTGDTFKFEREITNEITITQNGFREGRIRTGVITRNTKERDEQIGSKLEQELSGYETLSNAVSEVNC